MKIFTRYMAVFMCLLLVVSSMPVFAEGGNVPAPVDTEGGSAGEGSAEPAPMPASGETPASGSGETSASGSEETPTQTPVETESAAPAETDEPVNTEEPAPTPQPAVRFEADSLELGIAQAYRGIDLSAGAKVENAADPALVWTSSDTSVASFSGSVLTAHKTGSITVRASLASDASVYAEASVTISALHSLKFASASVSAAEEDQITLSVTLSDGTAIPAEEIVWTSLSDCASVSGGVVSCLSAGEADIRASWLGAEAVCRVSIAQKIVNISASPVSMFTNGSGRIVVSAVDGSQIDMSRVVFAPDAGYEKYFTIDSQGNIKPVVNNGLLAGGAASVTVNVKVTYRGGSAVVPVTINQAVLSAGANAEIIVPAGVSAYIGGLYSFNPSVNADEIVYVKSSNEQIMTAQSWCDITGVSAGSAELVLGLESGGELRIPVTCAPSATGFAITAPQGNLHIGTTVALAYQRVPAQSCEALSWTSSDTSVATVDNSGNVTFVNPGSVTITVKSTVSGASASVNLTAIRPVQQLVLYKGLFPNKNNFTLGVSKSMTPVIEVYPADATHAGYTLASSNEAVVRIEGKNIIAVSEGHATVTATSLDGEVTVTFNFTVVSKRRSVTSFKLNSSSVTLYEGKTRTVKARINSSAADKGVVWASMDPSIATVSQSGVITAVSAGTTTVYAISSSGAYRSVKVTVKMQLPTRVRLNKSSGSMYVGQEYQLVATISPSNVIREEARVLTWTSSNPSVATVSDTGYVIAVSPGKARITVTTVNGKKYNCTVRVKTRSVKLNKRSGSMYVGQEYQLVATLSPAPAQPQTLTWSSSNTNVVTVSESGYVVAVGPGSARITVTTPYGKKATCRVTVKKRSVKLNVKSGTMYIGEEYQLVATLSPASAQEQNLTWTTSNPAVVLVTSDGYVYAVGEGSAKITVTTPYGKSATCRVKVKSRRVSGVTVVNPYGQLQVGGTYDLNADIYPGDATNTALKWTLADANSRSIASINASTGELTCHAAGTVYVTATATDGSKKSHTLAIDIVSIPINSMTVTMDGAALSSGQTIQMTYGTTANVGCSVDPQMAIAWKSSDDRVVSIKDGVMTATGSGAAQVTVTAGGAHPFTFTVNVPYNESAPRYRALVIGQYQTEGLRGYLPFSVNSGAGIVDALEASDVDGSRYDVSYHTNLTSSAQVINAIRSTFAGARDGDVSVIYIMTHGLRKNGQFVWQLSGSGSKTVFVYPQDVLNAMGAINGDVVLMVLSCRSGGSADDPANLTAMVRNLDAMAGENDSYSIISATDASKRASYINTNASMSYDFFTMGMCESLGWDMVNDADLDTNADNDGNGRISLNEFASSTRDITAAECQEFLDKYSVSNYWGPPERRQDVTYYISPNAGDVPIFGN